VPWRLKRVVYLVVIGVAVLVLSIAVLVRAGNLDERFLALVGLLGGAAIVIVSLPTNGHDDEEK
jgi:peptidoglycan/LPS O-acetylase OafA/YrhL